MKATTKNGREVELYIEHNNRPEYITAKKRYEPRQVTSAYLSVDGNYYNGHSVMNPRDLFDADKGTREAVKKALSETGYSLLAGSEKTLTREERSDIWGAINKMTDTAELAASIISMERIVKKYSALEINQMLGFDYIVNGESHIDSSVVNAMKEVINT